MNEEKDRTISERICVYGIVQGVGFRPFVSRIADRAGISGSVANRGSYVEIFAEGTPRQLEQFHRALKEHPPERAAVLKIETKVIRKLPAADTARKTAEKAASREAAAAQSEPERFFIIESEKEAGDIFVSPDIATCPKCRQELFNPGNRRYLHPFINCTACGPRLTILDSMPYDRERTSMGEFPMCPACEYEYTHAETRRYDAQPVCCPDCGPEVFLLRENPAEKKISGRAAILEARRALAAGRILAVKGIGGFHLCCDAKNETAVRRLRELKHRPMKPFAVMMRDLDTVRAECITDGAAEEILDGHQKPIILLKKKPGGSLAPSVAPDNPNVGVMLPYAPVQMLLFDYDDGLDIGTDAFVMTSGNVSGAPICRTDEDALREIAGFCDLILSHNRKIRLRADDSVMDFYQGEPYMIRRSRGYAPLPIMLTALSGNRGGASSDGPGTVLAVGGELKNSFCIGKNEMFYLSPYVGDMEDVRTARALEESIARMEELLETEPRIAACDMHPDYNTVRIAEKTGLPVFKVQHHYAHILSCMAENDFPDPVIGVSFDGTGYGTDGTIWGGEILLADYDGFERAGSIRPFDQIGGDASAREGWRIAVSMLNGIYGEEAPGISEALGLCDAGTCRLYASMARRGINTVKSTSAGRLFDAVCAVLGIRRASSFEGEAAMALQSAAEAYIGGAADARKAADDSAEKEKDVYSAEAWENLLEERNSFRSERRNTGFSAGDNDGESSCAFELLTNRLFAYLTERKLAGEDSGRLAYEFHVLLADQIAAGVRLTSERTGIRVCALSGGVFQNTLLLELSEKRLKKAGIKVLRHRLVPPNDGGIALGQAAAAMRFLNRKKETQEKTACVWDYRQR